MAAPVQTLIEQGDQIRLYKIYEGREMIIFIYSCKYFILAKPDISSGIYEQYFYINIGRIMPSLVVSQDGYACSSVN